MSTAVHITSHGAQINFEDLPPIFNLWYNPSTHVADVFSGDPAHLQRAALSALLS